MTRAILPIPLILLICFLIGYLAVALFGTPDLIIAGILFGGSVFVFVVLNIMYSIIERLRESRQQSDALYAQILNDIGSLTQAYLMVVRANLTRDVIEELVENGEYQSGAENTPYSAFMEARKSRLLGIRQHDNALSPECSFTRDELLQCFEE
jgi:uncharacterized membrane protein (DUF485 family)